VFTGPGGGYHAKAGTRTVLSAGNFRRLYQRAATRAEGLDHLDLRGPHDLRHTFSTWLEDAGIPARVIDELMGHAGGRRAEHGSAIGRVYRETTPDMRARVVAAIEKRLVVVLIAAESAE
jgi:integrase